MSAPLTTFRPVLVRSAPPLDPPYDDELPSTPRQSHLRLIASIELPFETDDPVVEEMSFDPQPTRRADLPHPQRIATQLVQALLEVLGGRRPVQQLRPMTSEDVYARVQHRVGVAHGMRAQHRRRLGSTPAVEAPARVSSVHIDEPADGVAEITAVVRHGERHRAVALRLEGMDGRWRCTVLHML
jgi:hypothetical protein